MNKPKYFDYATRGNLIVLTFYLVEHEKEFNEFLRVSDQFELKRTGRRKGA